VSAPQRSAPRLTVIDHIRAHAEREPRHPALIVAGDGGARGVAYGDLAAAFDARARAWRAAGASAGSRCGLVARPGAAFIEAALGILAAGCCLVPIPHELGADALATWARDAHLHHLVREADGFALGRGADAPTLAHEDEFRALHPAYLRFTSGTTSRHKGVVLGHEAILARLANVNQELAIGPGDRVMWLLPMAHHLVASILLYLRQGATILLPASTLARPVLALAADARATVFYASPFHYNLLAKDVSAARLAALRLAVSTAESLRADVAARFAGRFGRPLVQALGIIEVGLPIMNLASAATKPTALGRPLPGYEVWLRGEDGRAVAADGPSRTGEICIRGTGMFDAYLEPWTPARAVIDPDGFRTGDQGWRDRDGDLHLAGRHVNRINMAGIKFFCEEVEAVLDAHPAVRVSRVAARLHARLGELPVAEIVPADPAQPPRPADLAAHCRARLESYKVPREFTVVERLPLTASGKLRRWSGTD